MSKPKVHYDDFEGGTEADTDPPDTLMCGTESGDPCLTQYTNQVTCKRCLKILLRAMRDRGFSPIGDAA